jgi:hypothetical protein
MSIYERGGETYRALQINGPDDGPAGADYIVRRDSDARFGGYIVDTARDDAGHPADPDLDADEVPHRFEAYDGASARTVTGPFSPSAHIPCSQADAPCSHGGLCGHQRAGMTSGMWCRYRSVLPG